jgi:plasmid stabilization system protein ParE
VNGYFYRLNSRDRSRGRAPGGAPRQYTRPATSDEVLSLRRTHCGSLERLFDFIAAEDPARARKQLLSVRRALELLADHPLLGREAEEGRRELILSRGRYGYIAKHRWLSAEDVVLILAVRHQREAGYTEE